jgi:hypothetical protein
VLLGSLILLTGVAPVGKMQPLDLRHQIIRAEAHRGLDL